MSTKTSSRVGRTNSSDSTAIPASSRARTTRGMSAAPFSTSTRTRLPSFGGSSRPISAQTALGLRHLALADQQLDVGVADFILQRLGSALGDDPAAVDDPDVVGQLVGLLQVLGGEEDGGAVVVQRPHLLPDRFPADRVEPGGRLVEEEHPRFVDERGGEVEPALHAARVGADAAVGGGGEVDPFQQCVGPFAAFGRRQALQGRLQADQLTARHQRIERRFLQGDTDRAPDLAGFGDDVVAGDSGAAAGRQQQRRQHPHRRRLAGAVGSEEAVDLALVDLEVDALDGEDLAEGALEPLDRDCPHARSPAARRPRTGGFASTQRRPFASSSASAASSSSSSRPHAACSCSATGSPSEEPTGTLIAGMPVRLARAPPRTLASSAVRVPEGSSTIGASSGGATAGTVGPGDHVDLLEEPGQRVAGQRPQLTGLDRRDRRQQQPVLEQAAPERAQLGIEVVEALRGDAAEALAVGDQHRRQGRRRQFGQLDLPHLAAGLRSRSSSIAASQASRTAGATSSETSSAMTPIRSAARLARRQLFAEQGRVEQAAVGGVGAEGAGDDRGRDLGHVVPGHRRAAEGRLQAGEAAVGGGVADRADPVGADRAGDQAARRPRRRARSRSRPGSARCSRGCGPGRRRRRCRCCWRRARACCRRRRSPRRRRAGHGRGRTRPASAAASISAAPKRCARQGSGHSSLITIGTPWSGPGGARREHLARALREGLDDRVQRRVPLLDPAPASPPAAPPRRARPAAIAAACSRSERSSAPLIGSAAPARGRGCARAGSRRCRARSARGSAARTV